MDVHLHVQYVRTQLVLNVKIVCFYLEEIVWWNVHNPLSHPTIHVSNVGEIVIHVTILPLVTNEIDNFHINLMEIVLRIVLSIMKSLKVGVGLYRLTMVHLIILFPMVAKKQEEIKFF